MVKERKCPYEYNKWSLVNNQFLSQKHQQVISGCHLYKASKDKLSVNNQIPSTDEPS